MMVVGSGFGMMGEIGFNEFLRYCSGGVGYGFSGSGFLLWWLAFVWVLWFDGMRNTEMIFFFFWLIFSGFFLR